MHDFACLVLPLVSYILYRRALWRRLFPSFALKPPEIANQDRHQATAAAKKNKFGHRYAQSTCSVFLFYQFAPIK